MFSIDSTTKNIVTWSTGLNPITAQNLTKNIERTLTLENIQTQIVMEEHTEHCSIGSYKKFVKKHCDCSLMDIEKIKYETTIKCFLKAFQEYRLQNKTLKETLTDNICISPTAKSARLTIAKYVASWNNRLEKKFTNHKTEKLVWKVEQVEQKYAELVHSTPFEMMYEEQEEISYIATQIQELKNLVRVENHFLGDLVENKTYELAQGLNKLEIQVNNVSTDVKQLLPKEKSKHTPKLLRDPINEETFQLILYNAGSATSYRKRTRQAQLRIAYTLLYNLGLRLNEIRDLKVEELQEGIQRSQLRIMLFKTNRSHNVILSVSAVDSLKSLKQEFKFLEVQNFTYLFGKTNPPHSKSLIRIVNADLKSTCQLCKIGDNLKSHSFRVSVISKLLRVTNVQNVADIIGHQDVRSTMKYNRYRLAKSAVQHIYAEAEKTTDFVKK
jgi:integrase